MNTNDCTCDAYGNRCTLHDEMNYIIQEKLSDEVLADLAAQQGEEVEILSDAEIIELLLEEEINND